MNSSKILSSIIISLLPKQIVGGCPEQGITETYTLYVKEKEIGYELDGFKRLVHEITDTRRYDDYLRRHLTIEEAALYLLKQLLDEGWIKLKDKSLINNFEIYFIP